jgi:predicted glycogen debranching enzyme
MRSGLGAELVLAADQFLVSPAARPEEATRAAALGREARTVIAGYHWFTDWGRDTMISLEGLTLATGRAQEAALILRTFAGYVRDGLIPTCFPTASVRGCITPPTPPCGFSMRSEDIRR